MPYIRYSVETYTVLIYPCIFFFCVWKIFFRKISRNIKSSAFFTGAMASSSDDKQSVVITQKNSVFRGVYYGTSEIRCIFVGNGICVLLIHFNRIQTVKINKRKVSCNNYLFRAYSSVFCIGRRSFQFINKGILIYIQIFFFCNTVKKF